MMSIVDELYEDTLINIKEFEQVRFFRSEQIPEIDPDTREDKDTIHYWPNEYAVNRFHRKNKDEFLWKLSQYDVKVGPSDFMFVYLPEPDVYEKYEPDSTLNYERFTLLRYYFMIKRLQNWYKYGDRVHISLQYQTLFPNKHDRTLSTSNTALLEYLLNHPNRDELTWIIRLEKDPKKYVEVDYPMTFLVFDELELFGDSIFSLEKIERKQERDKGFVLEEDREKYNDIVEKSYRNFEKIMDNQRIMELVNEHYVKYR